MLENNGGHTKSWHFGPKLDIITFVASGLDMNGCVLLTVSYFERTANVHCYTSGTLTTLHCSKVSFLKCHKKRYNKIFTKMWGVYSLLWDTVDIYIYIFFFTPMYLTFLDLKYMFNVVQSPNMLLLFLLKCILIDCHVKFSNVIHLSLLMLLDLKTPPEIDLPLFVLV